MQSSVGRGGEGEQTKLQKGKEEKTKKRVGKHQATVISESSGFCKITKTRTRLESFTT